MVKFNLTYGHNISLEQRVVFEVAARILGTYITDDTSVDVHVLGATALNDGNAVGGADVLKVAERAQRQFKRITKHRVIIHDQRPAIRHELKGGGRGQRRSSQQGGRIPTDDA